MTTLPLPEIHQRPLLTWVASFAVLLGFITAVLFITGSHTEDKGTNYYVPEGYRKNVTTMVKAAAIRHDNTVPADPRQMVESWGRLIFDKTSAIKAVRPWLPSAPPPTSRTVPPRRAAAAPKTLPSPCK